MAKIAKHGVFIVSIAWTLLFSIAGGHSFAQHTAVATGIYRPFCQGEAAPPCL